MRKAIRLKRIPFDSLLKSTKFDLDALRPLTSIEMSGGEILAATPIEAY